MKRRFPAIKLKTRFANGGRIGTLYVENDKFKFIDSNNEERALIYFEEIESIDYDWGILRIYRQKGNTVHIVLDDVKIPYWSGFGVFTRHMSRQEQRVKRAEPRFYEIKKLLPSYIDTKKKQPGFSFQRGGFLSDFMKLITAFAILLGVWFTFMYLIRITS